MMEQLLLTEPEAAKRLRLCTRTLQKARKDGLLHFVLIGRAVRYTVDDLESFVERLRRVQPVCPPTSPTKRSAPTRKSRSAVIVPFRERNKRQ